MMSPLDRAAHLNRWRHRSLTEKALLSLGLLILAVTLPPFPVSLVVAAVMTAATLRGARVPVRVWMAAAVAPVGFLSVGAISLCLQIDGNGVGWAPGGLHLAAGLAARSLAGVTCLLFLALTTPTPDLLAGLRRLGVPGEVVEVALLMYRFLFLLADTALAMDAAQAARLGHVGRKRRLHSLALLIANLLPRAFDRARRLEIGLAARGWRGEMRVLSIRRPAAPSALAAILAVETAIAALGVVPW